jgi:hypothetical protein
MEPLSPRITKSTAVAAIQARFETTEDLLKRFEVAKEQANLWDGERDGLREAVKKTAPGTYGNTLLSKTVSAEVLYPNAEGKFHLEECLQCDISSEFVVPGTHFIAFNGPHEDVESFLDEILSEMQKGKEHTLKFLQGCLVGHGRIRANSELFSKTASEKASITCLS